MKINWIEFENLETGLKCNKVDFYKDVTLLVGLSGAGKSQILNAIIRSFELILRGKSDKNNDDWIYPFTAKLNFSINDKEYQWEYRTDEIVDENTLLLPQSKYGFVYEKLSLNGEQILLRDYEKIELKDFDRFPTPKSTESLLSQYENENIYKEVVADFYKIFPLDMDIDVRKMITKKSFLDFKNKMMGIVDKVKSFSVFSRLPVIFKLYLAKEYFYDEIYVPIYNYVKELFPEISDIYVTENERRDTYAVCINVGGQRLLQDNISNGMLKTIYYIVELVTAQTNSLILIDEFENGLGVNCIDTLSDLLLNERNDLQFIITSHHPKIIGEISPNKWRIIERDNNIIKNVTSNEFGITNSKHNAYFNLLNRWEFEGKI